MRHDIRSIEIDKEDILNLKNTEKAILNHSNQNPQCQYESELFSIRSIIKRWEDSAEENYE